jgi:hypothetical protein
MTSLAGPLQSFNADLFPDKVQLNYEAMAANAFAFFSRYLFYILRRAGGGRGLSAFAVAAKSDYKSYLKAYQGGLL